MSYKCLLVLFACVVLGAPGCSSETSTHAFEATSCDEPIPRDANKECVCVDGELQCTNKNECTEPRPGAGSESECGPHCECIDGQWSCLLGPLVTCQDGDGNEQHCGATWTSPSGCECTCTSDGAECENCPTGCETSMGTSLDPASCNTCNCYTGGCTDFSCLAGCVVDQRNGGEDFYIDGDRFWNNDGCLATCVDGNVIVDESCVVTGTCLFEDFVFLNGESFVHPLNFCDTCSCLDGEVECTEVDCFFCRDLDHVYPPGPVDQVCDCGPGGVNCLMPQ
jgi:hypothetical protein